MPTARERNRKLSNILKAVEDLKSKQVQQVQQVEMNLEPTAPIIPPAESSYLLCLSKSISKKVA